MKEWVTLVLDSDCVASVLSLHAVINAVEEAFLAQSRGHILGPALLHIDSHDGEFHVKAGGLRYDSTWFAIKANAGFFQNEKRFGLPNILGVILLFDGKTGRLLCCMDSGHITALRTAAATAVAARRLARPDAQSVTICGCGRQGRSQLEALRAVLPKLTTVTLFDVNKGAALAMAKAVPQGLSATIVDRSALAAALRESDVVVTCTPSREFYVPAEAISPGTFISAIGTDSPEKQELDPKLLAEHSVVVDVLEQCAAVGELHHALEQGLLSETDVLGSLGDVVAGKVPGRTSPSEIVIFDATGTALQDVAASRLAYQSALEKGLGIPVVLCPGEAKKMLTEAEF